MKYLHTMVRVTNLENGRSIVLRVNDRGVNYRLLRLAIKPGAGPMFSAADLKRGREVIAHRDDAMIEAVLAFKTHAVVQIREGGSVKLRIYPMAGGAPREVAFNEVAYSAMLSGAREFDAPMSTNSLSNLLTALVHEGRLVRLQRGMFIHVDNVGLFAGSGHEA